MVQWLDFSLKKKSMEKFPVTLSEELTIVFLHASWATVADINCQFFLSD